MADYYLQNIKQSFSLSDIDSNMEFMNHFPEINQEISALNFQNFMEFSNENFFPQLIPECATISDNFPGLFIHEEKNLVPQISSDLHANNKRKEIDTPQSSGANSSVQGSANVVTRKNSGGRGKKPKLNEKEDTPKDVVHVRAKRGQATDSHSLAERVRRGKINERLRCLQDIVPGCYKTMGMSVMLDEIINYVQSLQSQVEFLSMKLTAASTFYDFNSETDAFATMQQVKAHEALKMQKIAKEGCEAISSSQFGPLDLSFGNYPSWPRNI